MIISFSTALGFFQLHNTSVIGTMLTFSDSRLILKVSHSFPVIVWTHFLHAHFQCPTLSFNSVMLVFSDCMLISNTYWMAREKNFTYP